MVTGALLLTQMIIRGGNDYDDKRDLEDELLDKLEKKASDLIIQCDNLIFAYSTRINILKNQLSLISKIKAINEERIENTSQIDINDSLSNTLLKINCIIDSLSAKKNEFEVSLNEINNIKANAEKIKEEKTTDDDISQIEENLCYVKKKQRKISNMKTNDYHENYILPIPYVIIQETIPKDPSKLKIDISISRDILDLQQRNDKDFREVLIKLTDFFNLVGIKNIDSITIENCDFSSYSIETKMIFKKFISAFSIIEKLNLQELNLIDDDINFFADCNFSSSLKSLNLGMNNLEKTDFLIGNYSSLRELYINDNVILSIDGIINAPNLEVLNASCNYITDDSVLEKMTKLVEVDLSDNPLSEDLGSFTDFFDSDIGNNNKQTESDNCKVKKKTL